ncbi:hypothetical protein PR048_002416 [Dryococelus australis]|uniref:Uncharacterized protein n=1 Tax=Dryococelus australis TaxID=614101 RepID=A0ABQ9ILL8_9NEOP|nr:hypothetical protein PR048_002416 [Dryococelus australis]
MAQEYRQIACEQTAGCRRHAETPRLSDTMKVQFVCFEKGCYQPQRRVSASYGFKGHGVKGHGIKGHGFKGHGVKGHGVKGHGVKAHGVKGHGVKGHGVNGHGVKDRGVMDSSVKELVVMESRSSTTNMVKKQGSDTGHTNTHAYCLIAPTRKACCVSVVVLYCAYQISNICVVIAQCEFAPSSCSLSSVATNSKAQRPSFPLGKCVFISHMSSADFIIQTDIDGTWRCITSKQFYGVCRNFTASRLLHELHLNALAKWRHQQATFRIAIRQSASDDLLTSRQPSLQKVRYIFTGFLAAIAEHYYGDPYSFVAVVAEQLACSPPTRANLVQPPAGTPAFSHMRIVPDDAARRVFSGTSRIPHPFIPALLHTDLASPTPALKAAMLRDALISPPIVCADKCGYFDAGYIPKSQETCFQQTRDRVTDVDIVNQANTLMDLVEMQRVLASSIGGVMDCNFDHMAPLLKSAATSMNDEPVNSSPGAASLPTKKS